MKKKTLWLLFTGILCISFTTFTRNFIHTPDTVEGLLKGLGVGIMIAALICEKRAHRVEKSRDSVG